MTVLILAAGEPSSESAKPAYPIWLSELESELLLERQVKAFSQSGPVIFTFRQADMDAFHLEAITRQIASHAAIVAIKRETAGAACTALLAISHIDRDAELIVASATDHIDADYGEIIQWFRDRGSDAGVLTFESLHPRYSYLKTDAEGWVVEAAEKRPISRQANAGFYWYARGGDFIDSVQQMILKDAEVNGSFYISPSLNELVLRGLKIACWELAAEQYHPLKDRYQIAVFEHALEERSRHAS